MTDQTINLVIKKKIIGRLIDNENNHQLQPSRLHTLLDIISILLFLGGAFYAETREYFTFLFG